MLPGAAVLYRNLADEWTMTASSWIVAAPPSNLQNMHTTRRWRGENGASEYVLAYGAAVAQIDTIQVLKLAKLLGNGDQVPMTTAATYRIRLSSVDQTGIAGDLYDSGIVSGGISEEHAKIALLLDTPLTAIAVRIDLFEADAAALLAGRLIFGKRDKFTINFGYGWQYGYSDLSRTRKSAGGQTFIDREERYRVLTVDFEAMPETDRYGFVDAIDRICGTSQDILFIIDQATDQPDRDSIWGLVENNSPPSQPSLAHFRKSYSISERL